MTQAGDGGEALDRLLQASIERAGPHLRESFQMPEHSLDAGQVRALFGLARTVALATVTAKGDPRVAPVDCFLHGSSFCIPTVAGATRSRHVQRHPATSLTCFEPEWAVLAHGESTIVRRQDTEFPTLEERAHEAGMASVLEWGEGVYIRMTPHLLFTWTRHLPGPPSEPQTI